MYLIGVVLSFILTIFFISIIHNKKLIEKYELIDNMYSLYKDFREPFYCSFIVAIILWPLAIIVTFIIIIGYCLFKIFSKLIDYFVK